MRYVRVSPDLATRVGLRQRFSTKQARFYAARSCPCPRQCPPDSGKRARFDGSQRASRRGKACGCRWRAAAAGRDGAGSGSNIEREPAIFGAWAWTRVDGFGARGEGMPGPGAAPPPPPSGAHLRTYCVRDVETSAVSFPPSTLVSLSWVSRSVSGVELLAVVQHGSLRYVPRVTVCACVAPYLFLGVPTARGFSIPRLKP